MLKITTNTDMARTTLELEGKLAGEWVEELRLCCREIPPGTSVTVSLKTVSFVDDAGKELLAGLYASGVALRAEGCMTREIIRDIMRAHQQDQLQSKNRRPC